MPLEDQIIAEFTAASWDVPFLFLCRQSDLTLVSGDVSNWTNLGTEGDATQGTEANRPTYQATGLNGKPTLDFDGNDWLTTASADLTSYTALVLGVLFEDDDTGVRYQAEYGAIAGGRSGILVRVNNPASVLEGVAFSTGGQADAASAASYTMASPNIVTATWDSALSTNEVMIRHGGADVTDSHPNNNDLSACMLATEPLKIGARYNNGSAMNGRISAVFLAAGSTAIPTTAVANVEALLQAEWGL